MEDVMGNCIFHIERKKERRNIVIEVSKNSREDAYEYDRYLCKTMTKRKKYCCRKPVSCGRTYLVIIFIEFRLHRYFEFLFRQIGVYETQF
jgi:hypothetical protein